MSHSSILVRCLLGVALGLGASRPLAAEQKPEETWKAGTARANITPGTDVWMGGIAQRTHLPVGKVHDIWIKVLALEDAGGHRAVVITSDVCGFARVSHEAICEGLQKRCGLDRSQVMLTYSHSHSGPALRECLVDYYTMDAQQRAKNDAYTIELEKTIVDKAAEALAQMTPATLWAVEGKTDFAVNRRNNIEGEVPKMLKQGKPLAGPVDHSIPMLIVRAPDGDLRAVVFGYACHGTTLDGYEWSGDFAGFAQIDLEQKHPGLEAMYYMGCGGDQNPLPRRNVELCRKYGQMLADGVEKALQKSARPIAPKLRTAFEFTDLDFQRMMTVRDLHAYAKRSGKYSRWANRLLKELDAGKVFPKSYPYAVEVWKLGDDQLWISLGGEVVVDYSLKFKKMYGPHTWVNGFAHDLTAYMPSRRVWDEGGYEGGALGEYGLPAMRWAPDVEDRITAAVERLVAKVK